MPLSVPNAVHQRWRPVWIVATLLVLSGCGTTVSGTSTSSQSSVAQPPSAQPPSAHSLSKQSPGAQSASAQSSSAGPSPFQVSTPSADGQLAQTLANEVSDTGAYAHLEELQKIADESGGNRAASSAGYES